MKRNLIILAVLLAVASSCKKKSVPISHTVRYMASADTFHFTVTYTNASKASVDDTVTNGWNYTFTISEQSNFPASLTLHADSGHHMVSEIFVDDIKVASTNDSTGHTTSSYIIP